MKRVKDIIYSISIILFVLGYVFSTLYNGNNTVIVHLVDFLSTSFVYPILLFVLGMTIYEENYGTKRLLRLSFYSFIISLFINIFCFSVIFFIQKENVLVIEYLFKTNIFTFITLLYLFMILIKKLDLSSQTLWGIGLLLSIINTILTGKYPVSNTLLGSLTSVIYSSSNYSSFSFLGWILFPIVGYIFREVIDDKKDKFYALLFPVFLVIYVIMLYYSKYVVSGGPLIDFENPYTFYHMNLYGGLMNMCLCVIIYSLSYFISKTIPSKLYRHVKRWSRNIILIYKTCILSINYIFLLILEGLIEINVIETLLLFILVFLLCDVISYTIEKKFIKNTAN